MLAYRPATLRNHRSTHMLYVQFCLVYRVQLEDPTVDDLGAFAEWLLAAGLASSTVRNQLSAVKTLYLWWDKPHIINIFNSPAWGLSLRGILNSTRPSQNSKTAVTILHLYGMAGVCHGHPELAPFWLDCCLHTLGTYVFQTLPLTHCLVGTPPVTPRGQT